RFMGFFLVLAFCGTLVLLGNMFSASGPIYDFINQRFFYVEDSFNSRNDRYAMVFEQLNNYASSGFWSLVLGSGSGNFSHVFDQQDISSYPHNIFLEVIYEYGLVGLILFFFVVIY